MHYHSVMQTTSRGGGGTACFAMVLNSLLLYLRNPSQFRGARGKGWVWIRGMTSSVSLF